MLETDSRNWPVVVGGLLVVGVIACLALAFVPPFHLLERVHGKEYTSLAAKSPIASHEDGIQIIAAPDDLDGSFGVQLDAVPQLTFLEGSAGSELRRAAESLPANLVVKGPYYKIATKGDAPDSTMIAVDIPNNAEPWETLDLYTWTGEGWEWVGGRVDTGRELILAQVGQNVPQSVVVVQAGAIPPAILSELPMGQPPTQGQVTHILLQGPDAGRYGQHQR